MGYLYGVKEFYGIAMYTQMALHTALAFIILSLGIFFILAEGQPTPILFKESLGGALARRMLALVVLVLLAVGWLGLQGELAGLYNNVFAFALVILIVAVILVIVVLNNAKAIDKLDHLRQQTEEKVKQRYYAEWDKTFNFISDSIFIMDCDHTIINANKAFFNLLHVRPEDTLGKNCYEVMHKLNKPWPNCPLVKTKTDKKVYTAEVDDPAIGVPLLVTTSPIFDDKGELIAIVHVSKDISELKRVENALRESEEKYRELFLSSSDALMTLTPGGKFSSGNPMAIKIFGCSSEEEFISKTPAELSPQYQSDGSLSQVKAKRMMDIAMEKGTHFFEWTHKRLNNEEFPATVLLTKIKIKGAEFLQASVRDISEAKRLESDLKERIRALERFQEITVDRELKMKELKERIKELEGKILKLQNADKS
jgi:PAS domain S-box-containing protein